jgi:uncharacterized protein (TIGR00290 family)
MPEQLAMSWSGGKDSALALHAIRTDERYRDYRVAELLTTVTAGYERVSGHGLHRGLIASQAESLGLSTRLAYIRQQSTMQDYNGTMSAAYEQLKGLGVSTVGFGDIFLKGPKGAHLRSLRAVRMSGVFPLWRKNSRSSVRQLMELGYEAVVICVDSAVLDESFLGRVVDEAFLADLPPSVDPSGENGEYHTFVVDGPLYEHRVKFHLGQHVSRSGYLYCDVLPVKDA